MDFRAAALAELQPKLAAPPVRTALVGLDGFVDKIVTPVALRHGLGDNYTPIRTIAEFAQRIAGAAGKSTNIELFQRMEKLGGNGPIMANALLAAGVTLDYVGALGRTDLYPIFRDMAARTRRTVTVAEPGITTAVEFSDGKLMLGTMACLDEIDYARLVAATGEAELTTMFATADLVALVNWTMIAHMSAIFAKLVDDVYPKLPLRPRTFFFDLADPEKRSDADLAAALKLIGRFEKFGRAVLGLNLKEAQHAGRVLGLPAQPETETGLRELARSIRAALGIFCVVAHPKESAACATAEATWWVPGPYTDKPLITTGAGDHFNAGFTGGLLLGLSPQSCLALAVSTSGHYVRTAQSPTLADLAAFLQNWK